MWISGARPWGAARFSCASKNLIELHCICGMGLLNIYIAILQQISFCDRAQKWPGGISVSRNCSMFNRWSISLRDNSATPTIHISLHKRWAIPAATFLQAINYAKNGKRLHFVSKQTGQWIFLAFVPLDLLASLPGDAKGDPGRFPRFFP